MKPASSGTAKQYDPRLFLLIIPFSKESTMKRLLAPGLALLAGVAIGAFAVHGLHAQATPPAYVITEIDVAEMEAFLKD